MTETASLSLGSERGLSDKTLNLFNVRENGKAWLYDTKTIDGKIITRRKSFYSTKEDAPEDERDGWAKYTWPEGKPDTVRYFYPPELSLTEAIERANGTLWIVGGDIAGMTMIDAGLHNSVSCFGDKVPDTLADDLKKWGATLICVVPDRDKGGERWACKIRDTLAGNSNFMLVVFELPYELGDKHGKDVNDYWLETKDKTEFLNRLESLPEWKLPEPEVQPTTTPIDFTDTGVPELLKFEILRQLGVADRFNKEGWARKNVQCPFHDDQNASATWQDESNILYCHTCGQSYLVKDLCEHFGIRMGDYYKDAPVSEINRNLPTEKQKEPLKVPDRHQQVYAPKLPDYVTLSDEQLYEAQKGRVWLDEYIQWCTDGGPLSPPIFYEAMGLWTLAMAATRRMKVQIGNENIYPNLYVFIVAQTTVYRKSTALNICNQFIDAAKLEFLKLPERATPEALFEFLAGKEVKAFNGDKLSESEMTYWRYGRTFAGQRAIMEDEASALLSEMRKDYMAGLSELLLKGYDGQGVLRKLLKSQGLITVKDMCLSFLGATTPVEWGRRIGNEERQNGFIARFAIITPESPPIYREALDAVEPPHHLIRKLRRMFREILPWDERCMQDGQPHPLPEHAEVTPPPYTTVSIEGEAFDQIKKYRKAMSYEMLAASGQGGEIGDDKAPGYARLATMVIKVAMLLAAIEAETKNIRIEPRHAYAAQQICERWRESLHRLDIDVARAKYEDVDERVLNFIKSSGNVGVTVRDIQRSCNITTSGKAKEMLATLVDAGVIEMFKREPAGGRGRPAVCYRHAS